MVLQAMERRESAALAVRRIALSKESETGAWLYRMARSRYSE